MVGLFLNDEKCLLPVCYIWNEQFPIILFLIWVHRGSKTWQEILRRIIKFNKSWVRYSINQSRILAVAAVRLKEGDGELGQDCEELKMSDATYSNLKKKKKKWPTGNFGVSRHASCPHFSSSSCPVLGSALQALQRCVFKRWSRPVPWAL